MSRSRRVLAIGGKHWDVCIYPFLFHMESFFGDECSKHVASILSDKDSESVKYF